MGWVFIVIPLLIHFYAIVLVTEPWLLYWLLNHKHVCCAQMTCAGWVYIFGGRVKNVMF